MAISIDLDKTRIQIEEKETEAIRIKLWNHPSISQISVYVYPDGTVQVHKWVNDKRIIIMGRT